MASGGEYEIVVAGDPGPRALAAIPGFEVTGHGTGTTRLRGWVRDQSALQGVVRRLGDLGVEIECFRRIGPPEDGGGRRSRPTPR